MTDVTIVSGGQSVSGKLTRLSIGQEYPSRPDGNRTARLEMIVGDSVGLQALLDACGDCDADNPADGDVGLSRLSRLDRGVDGGFRLPDRASMIEQLRLWLAKPSRLPEAPIEWVRVLMIEYDLQRSKTAIANREVERLKNLSGQEER